MEVRAWLETVRVVRFSAFETSIDETLDPSRAPKASNLDNWAGSPYKVTVPSPATVPEIEVGQSISGLEATFSYTTFLPSPQSTPIFCNVSTK